HRIVGLTPATFGPHVVIAAVALEHQRAFHILRRRGDLLEEGAVVHRHHAAEIVLQPDDVGVLPAAINHVPGTIVVLEHELVDRLRPIVEPANQRLAEQVAVGAFGPVGHGYADATDLVI